MANAILKCISLRTSGADTPTFELVYNGKVETFDADHVGEAGQIARHKLNQNGFRDMKIEWLPNDIRE